LLPAALSASTAPACSLRRASSLSSPIAVTQRQRRQHLRIVHIRNTRRFFASMTSPCYRDLARRRHHCRSGLHGSANSTCRPSSSTSVVGQPPQASISKVPFRAITVLALRKSQTLECSVPGGKRYPGFRRASKNRAAGTEAREYKRMMLINRKLPPKMQKNLIPPPRDLRLDPLVEVPKQRYVIRLLSRR